MTYGPAFDEARDGQRIRGQIATIRELLLPMGYLTLAGIARLTGYPEGSIGADLRHLKKVAHGSYDVLKQRINNTWYYTVNPPLVTGQQSLWRSNGCRPVATRPRQTD